MPMIKTIANNVSTAATGVQGSPVALNTSPFLGGQAHEAILNLTAVPAGVTAKLQGHNAANGLGDAAPAAGDAGWYDVATLTSASLLKQEIADLPAWIRTNITAAAAGNLTVTLEGVQ